MVPANPLTAQGLATPFQLTGPNGMTPAQSGCTMANFANLGAFVQATILNPATGALSVYEPLVITQGTTAAVAPVVPTLPQGAVVTIDFGFNGTNLTQVGATRNALRQGNCVNGLNGSIFGQVSFCNGTQFFQAAFQAERSRASWRSRRPAPPPKIAGSRARPPGRFTMIDQDQSDNVTTHVPADRQRPDRAVQRGQQGRDGRRASRSTTAATTSLLDGFLDPTVGCTPFEAPDLSQAGTMGTSQALDELSAAKNQAAPVALVPENDEMILVNNAFSATKTNLYRSNVGQPPISNANNAADSPANYCQNMVNVQTPFLANNQTLLAGGATPGARDRQQPAHLHGQPAEHVLHQPQLPELRAEEPGDGHPGRERRGHRGHVQHRPADGDQHGRHRDARRPAARRRAPEWRAARSPVRPWSPPAQDPSGM